MLQLVLPSHLGDPYPSSRTHPPHASPQLTFSLHNDVLDVALASSDGGARGAAGENEPTALSAPRVSPSEARERRMVGGWVYMCAFVREFDLNTEITTGTNTPFTFYPQRV